MITMHEFLAIVPEVAPDKKYGCIDAVIDRESAKAVMVSSGRDCHGKTMSFWVPKSLCRYRDNGGDFPKSLAIPTWFIHREDLYKYF